MNKPSFKIAGLLASVTPTIHSKYESFVSSVLAVAPSNPLIICVLSQYVFSIAQVSFLQPAILSVDSSGYHLNLSY